MKFRTLLTEATLLKRYFRFLVEVELKDKRKRTLYCPNIGPLPNMELSGTKLWYRSANRLSQGYLDILELIELDQGSWVATHPEYAEILVREGMTEGVITELQQFRVVQVGYGNQRKNKVTPLVKENGEQCFIHILPIFNANERGEGVFPETYEDLLPLNDLLMQREAGNRTVLFFCVQHTGIKCVRLNELLQPSYSQILRKAVSMGLEVLAYRANINLREITLETRIPVLLSEGITSG